MPFLLLGLFFVVNGSIMLRRSRALDSEEALLELAESFRRSSRFGGWLPVGAGACMAIGGGVLVLTGAG